MYKKISIIAIVIILTTIFETKNTYSAFYDMEYPPNSTGYADYTEEDARKDAEQQNLEAQDSSYYVGKSSNSYLKSLSVENATLEPEFNRQYLDYKIILNDSNTKKINIIAETEDEKATIQGAGEIELKEGINQIPVEVRAENGNLQIYNLSVELPYEQSDVKLQDLEIYGVNVKTGNSRKQKLIPDFKSDIYEYNINVSYNISYLDIRAKYPEKTYITTTGGEDLQIGQNNIIIKVIDEEDESKVTTYVIKVERAEDEKNYKPYIISASVIIFITIIIFIIIFTKKRKKR